MKYNPYFASDQSTRKWRDMEVVEKWKADRYEEAKRLAEQKQRMLAAARMFLALALIAFVLMLMVMANGCSKQPKDYAVPRSSLTKTQATEMAEYAATYIDRAIVAMGSGESMLPVIDKNSVLVAEPTKVADLHVGDIILYKPSWDTHGSAVGHRVIRISRGLVEAEGDHNGANHPDPYWISQQQIIGRVVAVFYSRGE